MAAGTNAYYREIMSLHGLEDFKEVIEQWQRLSENITKFHAKQKLVLPNMLWATDNGLNREHLLALLTNFMYSSGNLLDFYGNVRCLEYFMDYVPADKECHEIEKIGEKIRDAAGFRSEYRGLLSVDVSEWTGHFEDAHFIDIMKYLATMDEDICYIFQIPNYNPQAVQQLTQLLVLFFRIQPIQMNLPDSEELCNYIRGEISDFGLNLDQEAEAMIIAAVNRLREDQYFAGYEMLDRLASDIVYSVYTSTPPYDGIVTKGMISAFAPDGFYVSELIQNNARVFTAQFNY
ncbi:MAG: hypothetical protein IK115_07610 [Lachnospiraceae bacterium]|nr:hypothetical protein [Lachnospiraceae bacterium]